MDLVDAVPFTLCRQVDPLLDLLLCRRRQLVRELVTEGVQRIAAGGEELFREPFGWIGEAGADHAGVLIQPQVAARMLVGGKGQRCRQRLGQEPGRGVQQERRQFRLRQDIEPASRCGRRLLQGELTATQHEAQQLTPPSALAGQALRPPGQAEFSVHEGRLSLKERRDGCIIPRARRGQVFERKQLDTVLPIAGSDPFRRPPGGESLVRRNGRQERRNY